MAVILYTRSALRALRRLPANERERVQRKIALLAEDRDALAANIAKLSGRKGYRLRVGNWRIIFEWRNGEATVLAILDVGPRGGIYG